LVFFIGTGGADRGNVQGSKIKVQAGSAEESATLIVSINAQGKIEKGFLIFFLKRYSKG
jgi:hypothetical protein